MGFSRNLNYKLLVTVFVNDMFSDGIDKTRETKLKLIFINFQSVVEKGKQFPKWNRKYYLL